MRPAPCYAVSVGRASAPRTEAEGARKEAPMQEQSSGGKTVTETIEIKITIKRTITETERNKRAACSCSSTCKR